MGDEILDMNAKIDGGDHGGGGVLMASNCITSQSIKCVTYIYICIYKILKLGYKPGIFCLKVKKIKNINTNVLFLVTKINDVIVCVCMLTNYFNYNYDCKKYFIGRKSQMI